MRLLIAKPSEYMACERVFVSCEPEEKTLRYVPDFFPEDNILFATELKVGRVNSTKRYFVRFRGLKFFDLRPSINKPSSSAR